MKNAIIVHGKPSKEEYFDPKGSQHNKHWLPWLQQELSKQGVQALIPEFPEPYEPNYEKWKSVMDTLPITEHTILVGHSCGAGFLVRWLSENKIQVDKVALVAPWIDTLYSRAPEMFTNLVIDETLASRTMGVCIFISSDDDEDIQDSVQRLTASIKDVELKEFEDKGHFVKKHMKTEEFPELRDYLLQ